MLRILFAALLLIQAVPAQKDVRLPNGKSRTMAIVKADHEKSKEDVREILELAEELKSDFDANDEFVVDLRSLRRAERIEKLAKDIKNRMKRLN